MNYENKLWNVDMYILLLCLQLAVLIDNCQPEVKSQVVASLKVQANKYIIYVFIVCIVVREVKAWK